MRILVGGRRPVAAVLAALLSETGEDAFLFDPASDVPARLKGGLVVEHDEGERRLPVRVAAGLEGVYDVIVLAAAAAELDQLLRTLSPYVHRHTFYLDVSGNLGFEHIGQMVGPRKVLPGAPGWAAEWREEGRRARLVGRGLCIGEAGDVTPECALQIAEAIAATKLGPARVSATCDEELWADLCYRLPLESLRAVLSADFSELMELEGLPDIVLKAAGEVREVARSLGLSLEALHDWSALKESENGGRQDAAVTEFFAHAHGLAVSMVKPQLLADLEAGRPTDNRFLAGSLVEKARASAVSTPVCNALFTLLREMERGARKPSPDNLRELTRRFREDDNLFLS